MAKVPSTFQTVSGNLPVDPAIHNGPLVRPPIKYRQKHPSPCMFCGTLIRCDMYRHVARCHLELAQLWWCPVSWCTIWKGAPQDLMDHVCGAHNVPGEIKAVSLEKLFHVCRAHNVPREIKAVSLEKLFPPWTATHQVYTESLTSQHSSISNDVMLFSDIGLSLVHHYRVHKRGLPMSSFGETICCSCALFCLWFCQSKGDRPTLHARLCHVPWTVQMLYVPCLDHPEARSVAGGQFGSWSHL